MKQNAKGMRWMALLALLGLCLSLAAGCARVAEGQSTVAARLPHGTVITLEEVKPYFQLMALQQGALGEGNEEYQGYLWAVALENVITKARIAQKAKELGLGQWSQAQLDALEQQAQQNHQQWLEQEASKWMNWDIATDEEKERELRQARLLYDNRGVTQAFALQLAAESALLEEVKRQVVKEVGLSLSEMDAFVQQCLDFDVTAFQGYPEEYDGALAFFIEKEEEEDMFGIQNPHMPPLYRPAGFRGIRSLLLQLPEEDLHLEYLRLRAAYNNQQAGLSTDKEPVQPQQLEDMRQLLLAGVAQQAEEVARRYAGGESFDILMEEYGYVRRQGMARHKTSGFEIYEGSVYYDKAMVEAAFALEKEGDISPPVVTSNGIEILHYTAELPEGPVPLRAKQWAVLRQRLQEARQEEAFSQAYEGWVLEGPVTYTGVIPSLEEAEQQLNARAGVLGK